jgi:hypothetical protein
VTGGTTLPFTFIVRTYGIILSCFQKLFKFEIQLIFS